MKKIIIIGTLHAGFTDEEELKSLLDSYRLDQLLVEIAQEDIERGDMASYPPEMIAAYEWGMERGIAVGGFDSKIDTSVGGFSEERNDAVIGKQGEIIRRFDWKDFNKPEIGKLIDIPEALALVDSVLEAKRESEMLDNVKRLMLMDGTVVIVTGASHLDFFERNIPGAVLPLRYG